MRLKTPLRSKNLLLLLHNDTEFIGKDGMNDLLAYATRADVGIVGAKLLFSDDTVQHAGLAVGPRWGYGEFRMESSPFCPRLYETIDVPE